ncbi:hypothetical protein TPY_2235 [Sulfobacillus acidophilus TPY]|nr:hypothetical protein TPY_2235 [Sulfobacillus acidophilus TPY]
MRYKQRHTAERVYQRLQDEYGDRFTCSYSTVQRFRGGDPIRRAL